MSEDAQPPTPQAADPVSRSGPAASAGEPAGVILAVVVALALTAAVLAGVLFLVNREQWWNGFLAAIFITLLSAALSLPPLVWGLRHGLTRAVAGYFIAAGLRIVMVIAGFVLAVLSGGYEPLPTAVLMMVFYLVLLGVESAWLARAVWTMKSD